MGDIIGFNSLVSEFEDSDFIDDCLNKVIAQQLQSKRQQAKEKGQDKEKENIKKEKKALQRHINHLRLHTLLAAEKEWLTGASPSRIAANGVALGYLLLRLGDPDKAKEKVFTDLSYLLCFFFLFSFNFCNRWFKRLKD